MLNRIALLVVLILSSCVSARGDDGKNGPVVDGERTKAYVVYLSADPLEGRMTCTEGYRKAADWVAARFQQWGLKPAGEDGTYFQKVSIRGFDWNTGVPALKVGGREFLFDDGDYSVDALSTPGTALQGDVVFAGYGIAAPEKGLNEYEGVDVKGKIALVFKGSPKDAPKPRQMFRSQEDSAEEKEEKDEWKEESADLAKMKTAYERGAAAVLLYDPDEEPGSETRRSRSSRRSRPPSFEPERKFLCFTIHERVFRAIMKRDPQQSPQGLKRRMDALRREIKQKKGQSRTTGVRVYLKGYDASQRFDEEHGNNVARNVLAKIEGTDPQLKDQYVLVGAHLDHVGMRGGYVYNGADDNASGSAVVMEVGRVLSEANFKPKRTLIFCCWCGEERGLIGSVHYTNHPCDAVAMDNVVAYFNVDMVGMGEDLNAPGALNFPAVWDVIKRDQDPKIIKRIKPREGGPGGSDHTGFIRRGIEALALMSSGGVGHQDYHQPEDDAAKIEPEMLRVTGQFILLGMMNLADETEVQLPVQRRQQLYRGMRMQISNFNPDLPGGSWTCVEVKQESKEALSDEIYDQARKMFRGSASAGSSSGQSPRAKASLARGLPGLKLVGDDVRLLKLALDFYAAGRVDIQGDDGVCVVEGRLTDDGKAALKVLEENGVVVRLVSPPKELIDEMLSAASKPFIITGEYHVTDTMADPLNAKGIALGIDLDPQKIEEFITRLDKVKLQLGERKNLFAYLTAEKELSEAKRPLYLGLIDKGWTHNEIVGTREHRGLLGGATLGTLGGRTE